MGTNLCDFVNGVGSWALSPLISVVGAFSSEISQSPVQQVRPLFREVIAAVPDSILTKSA
jgi:hypothetical protein